MNAIAILFLVINVALLLLLPRRWAPMPLLVGACYMTLGQGIEVGPFHFTVIRLLIFTGIARIIIRGERFVSVMNALDWLVLAWGGWALISGFFHNNPTEALIFRLGVVYNACGIYFLLRVFCQSIDDVLLLCLITAILLVPLGMLMLYEKVMAHNLFSMLGGVPENSVIREGKIRAQGPFAHAILAGTVGAASIPVIIGIWQQHRKTAFIGLLACSSIVVASASSGPILSAVAAIGALLMWSYRYKMRFVRWFVVLGYVALDMVMKAPAYFLIARMDIIGGSTGWYRAKLIQSAFQHLNEWWIVGTDYTRHWMPSGVGWSPDQTDITNHYLEMGVLGGLPLMLLFIASLVKGFSFVGETLLQYEADMSFQSQFMVWAFGAALFAHAVTFISVSYFDQSFVFIYMILAAIGSVRSAIIPFENTHAIAANEQYFVSVYPDDAS